MVSWVSRCLCLSRELETCTGQRLSLESRIRYVESIERKKSRGQILEMPAFRRCEEEKD